MVSTTSHELHTHPAAEQGGRRWWPLGLLVLAQLMLVLDVTVVNVSLPTIGRQLRLSRDAVPWVMTAYTVVLGGVMLLGGRVADLLGPRRLLQTALVVFTAASAVGGAAQSGGMLLVSRGVQGLAAAFLSPAALALVTTTYDGEQRALALRAWATLAGAGSALGVVLGGVLTSTVGWRWIFYVNVPIGAFLLLTVPGVIPARLVAVSTRRLDALGALLVTAGTGSILYGLINSGGHGWAATSTLVSLAVGVLAWAGFVAVELRAPEPLLALGLLRRASVAGSAVLITLATALLVGGAFLASFLLQRGHDYSAMRVGLLFLPMTVATMLGSQLAGHLLARLNARLTGTAGLAVAAVGYGIAAWSPQPAEVVTALAVSGLGIGACFVTAFTTAMADVGPEEAGLRSAMTTTFHELGAAIGIAVLSSVAGAGLSSTRIASHDIGLAYTVATVAAAAGAVVMAAVLPPVKVAAGAGLHGGH